MSRGVPGTSTDKRHYEGAMSVFKKYPGVQIVAEYYSYWDDRITQQETAKARGASRRRRHRGRPANTARSRL